MAVIHNVSDRRFGWIGSWEAEPLCVPSLTEADKGRTVIYQDHGRAEAGTLISWNSQRVWARYSTGDTAAAAAPENLSLAKRTLDGDENRVRA